MNEDAWKSWENVLRGQLGRDYLFGGKWPLGIASPSGGVDCSGFTRWAYSMLPMPLLIPEGSQAQYLASHDPAMARIGDLGFFATDKDPKRVRHVGILLGDEVIEARGNPYNKVIVRPRANWEAWKDFMGWHRMDVML